MSQGGAGALPSCSAFARSLDAYVDGELDPGHAMDVEAHLGVCVPCAEQVATARAVRASLQRACRVRASDAMRVQVCAAMLRERLRVPHGAPDEPHDGAAPAGSPKVVAFKVALAFAAAAGVAFALGLSRMHPPSAPSAGTDTASVVRGRAAPIASATVGLDTLLDDLVSLHAHPLPPETTDPNELQRFDPLVGVPVRRPAFHPLVSFNGARVHALRDRRAALLQYTVAGGRRVTVYVFDPRAVPVTASRLQPRVIREHPVYVGKLRGYSVAAAEQKGVGYALASDFEVDESSKLVLSALEP